MRVALLAPLAESVPPRLYGGTERVVYNLCRGLTESDVEVTLFASADSTAEGRLIATIDQAVRLRPFPPFQAEAFDLRMLARVADLASEFDVIHNHHDLWMMPLTRMVGTPVVTTLHGRIDPPETRAAWTAFHGAPLISISDSQRAPAPRLNWMRTIHHGLDVERYEFHPNPGTYLAFLGRIDPEKRPDWAIEVARKAGVPLKIAAKVEGKKGREYFESRVAPHVDGRFIEFIGEISESEKGAFLGGALATVFPVDWPEPFGLVPIESLAFGTPVLARPCGAVPEILKDGVTGFVDPSLDRLAEAVGRIGSVDRRGCREWFEKRFSLERMTEEYIDVYRQLIEHGSRAIPIRGGQTQRAGFHRH